MFIKKIKLKNFRNYEDLEIDFDKNINIIFGNNAEGKTNIIEAIYICSTAKSQKKAKDTEIINFLKEEAHIKEYLEKNKKEYIIDVHLKKKQNKGIAINGVKIEKISNFFGISNVILFTPEDLNIIKNGPKERRNFLDFEICQFDKIYIQTFSNYYKILNNRNKLLKEIFYKKNDKELLETLDIWDLRLVEYGKEIIKKRKEIIENIKERIKEIHYNISGKKEELEIFYEQNVKEEEYYNKLIENRENDLKLLTTTIGPHRDDIKFMIKNKDIRYFGSQGQQRTVALSLKLAEIEIIKDKKNDTPILLLDDVFSELDEERQKYLIENLKEIQTIITCTGLKENIKLFLHPNKILYLKNNKIIEKKEGIKC